MYVISIRICAPVLLISWMGIKSYIWCCCLDKKLYNYLIIIYTYLYIYPGIVKITFFTQHNKNYFITQHNKNYFITQQAYSKIYWLTQAEIKYYTEKPRGPPPTLPNLVPVPTAPPYPPRVHRSRSTHVHRTRDNTEHRTSNIIRWHHKLHTRSQHKRRNMHATKKNVKNRRASQGNRVTYRRGQARKQNEPKKH